MASGFSGGCVTHEEQPGVEGNPKGEGKLIEAGVLFGSEGRGAGMRELDGAKSEAARLGAAGGAWMVTEMLAKAVWPLSLVAEQVMDTTPVGTPRELKAAVGPWPEIEPEDAEY